MKIAKIFSVLSLIYFISLAFPSVINGQICTSTFHTAYCVSTQHADCCFCYDCACIGCEMDSDACCDCYSPPSCGISCFLPGTNISTPEGEVVIEEIKTGDKIQGFDPETKEQIVGVVSESYSVVRDHYYVIKTESGKEVKTTDEHPLYVGKETQPDKSPQDYIKNFYTMLIIYLKDGLGVIKKNLF